MRLLVLLALVGCRGSTEADVEPIQPASAPLSIGFAGAPTALFGTVEAPDFVGPFQQMADAGADQFFPLFLTSEVDGQAQTTGHLSHFLSPSLLDSADAMTCRGASDPYAAAEGRLNILFPGFILLQLQALDVPLDRERLARDLLTQQNDCWADHGEIISAFDTYDEPVLNHAVAQTLGQPGLDLDNIAIAAEVVDEVLGLPTLLIEGPGPLLFDDPELTDDQRSRLQDSFATGLEQVASQVDTFGFDVYPVPDLALTEPGAYVEWARELSGDGRTVSVLQGFGYEQTTLGAVQGRLPSEAELRFMAFDSVAAGADELLWYGQSALDLDVPSEAQLWQDLLTVTAEVSDLRDVVTKPVVVFEQSDDRALRGHGGADGLTLIVVNRMDVEQTFALPLKGAVSVSTMLGRNGVVADETLTTTLAATSAAVFDITLN